MSSRCGDRMSGMAIHSVGVSGLASIRSLYGVNGRSAPGQIVGRDPSPPVDRDTRVDSCGGHHDASRTRDDPCHGTDGALPDLIRANPRPRVLSDQTGSPTREVGRFGGPAHRRLLKLHPGHGCSHHIHDLRHAHRGGRHTHIRTQRNAVRESAARLQLLPNRRSRRSGHDVTTTAVSRPTAARPPLHSPLRSRRSQATPKVPGRSCLERQCSHPDFRNRERRLFLQNRSRVVQALSVATQPGSPERARRSRPHENDDDLACVLLGYGASHGAYRAAASLVTRQPFASGQSAFRTVNWASTNCGRLTS